MELKNKEKYVPKLVTGEWFDLLFNRARRRDLMPFWKLKQNLQRR
jgi:hypothetical protein